MRLHLALVFVLSAPALATGHEWPRPTRGGIEELTNLLDGCVKDGGLKPVMDSDNKKGEPYFVVADARRLRRAVAARRERITPAMLDALIAGWQVYDAREEPFAIALLEAIGAECDNDRARAFAALFRGQVARRRRRFRDTVRDYEEAERRFAAIGDAGWQATALNDLGLTHADLQELPQALACYEKSYKLRIKRYGPTDAVVATSLNNMGVVRHRRAEYAAAAADHQRALDIRRKAFHSPHRLIAHSLIQLGMARHFLHQYAPAEAHYREALANLREPADRDLIAEANNCLGGLHEYRGEYAQALRHYRLAGDMWLELYGTLRHPRIALALNNIGSLHVLRGELEQARASLETALRLFRELNPGDDPGTAACLDNLVNLELSRGDDEAALRHAREALAMWGRLYPGRHPNVARAWNNLGGVHEHQSDYTQARTCYLRARQIWEQISGGRPYPDLARCLDNLAQAAYRQGDAAGAVRHARQAREMFEKLYPSGHPERAGALGNEAWHLLHAERFDEAARTLDGALAALGTDRSTGLPALPETVKLLYLRGLADEKRLGDGGSAADWRRCAELYARAADILDKVRDEVLLHGASRTRLGEEVYQVFPRLVGAYQRLVEREAKAGPLEAAFTAIEKGTARQFLAALGQARAAVIGGVSPELRRQEAELRQQRDDLSGRILHEQTRPEQEEDPKALRALLEQKHVLEGRLRDMQGRIEVQYPRFARFRSPRPCTLAEARACLDADEVALLYLPGQEASYLLLVEARRAADARGGGLSLYRLPAEANLAELVATLTDPETLQLPDEARRLGTELYRILLAPAADRIRDRHLVIRAGGVLSRLPFELLVEGGTDRPGRFLIETHRLRYAPSMTVLHLGREWARTRRPPTRGLWAVGDPLYDPADPRWPAGKDVDAVSRRQIAVEGIKGFSPLRFSGTEIDSIRAALDAPARLYRGAEATEAAVKADSAAGRLADYRYVHFAAHGLVSPQGSRSPALILSLVGNDGRMEGEGSNDGFFRLEEVTNLHLNADLTVLSACRSGQGRLLHSEGVVGLARAFLYAGSRGVLCSLWSVEDRQTAVLMKDIYRRLPDNPTAAAVQSAQREMIAAGKTPFYWAPFVLIGE